MRVDALIFSDTHKLVCTLHWHFEDSLSNNLSLGFHQDGEEVLLLTDVRHPCLALVDRDFADIELTLQAQVISADIHGFLLGALVEGILGCLDVQSHLEFVAVGGREDKTSVNVSPQVIGGLDCVDGPLIVAQFQVTRMMFREVVVICSADGLLSMPVAQSTWRQTHLYLDFVIDIHEDLLGRVGIRSIDAFWRHFSDNFVMVGHGKWHESEHSLDHVVGHLFCGC